MVDMFITSMPGSPNLPHFNGEHVTDFPLKPTLRPQMLLSNDLPDYVLHCCQRRVRTLIYSGRSTTGHHEDLPHQSIWLKRTEIEEPTLNDTDNGLSFTLIHICFLDFEMSTGTTGNSQLNPCLSQLCPI